MVEDCRVSIVDRKPTWASCFAILVLTSTPTFGGDQPTVPPEPKWTAEQRQHWAFVVPGRPAIPDVGLRRWVRNPIDAFVLKQIEETGLVPADEADRSTLIRRLRFDLTGLPPTIEEIEAFRSDPAADAYERLVDRLLASTEYGERWARSWLDLARYADSDGYKNDKGRPNAWRYRDWVVNALNADMPYDRFVALQLAGDEIAPGDNEAFIATGFNRNFPFEDNNMVPGLNQQLILDDVTDTTSAVVLGLTVACARCHDHKYDPISQRDYYRIQALFVASQPKDDYVIASPEEQAIQATMDSEHQARLEQVRSAIELIERPTVLAMLGEKYTKLPAIVREAYEADPDRRTSEQEALLKKNSKVFTIDPKKLSSAMPEEVRLLWQARQDELKSLISGAPIPLPVASGMTDSGPKAPPAHLFRKGNFANPGEVIEPGFLSVLGPTELSHDPSPGSGETTGRRKALAE